MRLWMLVDPGFPELAAKADRLYASWEKADPDCASAYPWMVAQMVARGLDTNGHPPFWAWHSCGAPGRRIDLRTFFPVAPTLRLTLEVPDHLVLLSDYTVWHCVLGNSYLSATEAEYDRIEALEDAGQLEQHVKEASWQRIFDLTQWGDPDWCGLNAERHIQACTPWFEHRWIRKIERFAPPKHYLRRMEREARQRLPGSGTM